MSAPVIAKNDKGSNHLFNDSYHYFGNYSTETIIKIVTYNAYTLEEKELDTSTNNFKEYIKDYSLNWIQVTGLSNSDLINRLLADFDIDQVDIKAVFTPFHAAKIDYSNQRNMIVLDSCLWENNGNVTSEHICILSKDNIVFTFRERDISTFDNVMDRLRSNTMNIRTENRAMLVAFILNNIFSEIIGTSLKVERMLEQLDDILLDNHHNNINIGRRIQQCSHANLIIKKTSIPLKLEFSKLFHTDIVKNDASMLQVYNELYNQLDFINLTSGNSKELLSSMRDLYVSNNGLRTNAVMKRLTIVSTLFIPVTFLVGFWGMNFRIMPETQWKFGYFFAILLIVVTMLTTWKFMKNNNWF